MSVKMKKNVDIPFDSIACAYIGKAYGCMCGCSGNYMYTSKNADYSEKNRGYTLSPDEISDRTVRARLNKFLSLPGKCEILDDWIFTKYYGQDRQITIYLKHEDNDNE